jgi:hypothetical protein
LRCPAHYNLSPASAFSPESSGDLRYRTHFLFLHSLSLSSVLFCCPSFTRRQSRRQLLSAYLLFFKMPRTSHAHPSPCSVAHRTTARVLLPFLVTFSGMSFLHSHLPCSIKGTKFLILIRPAITDPLHRSAADGACAGQRVPLRHRANAQRQQPHRFCHALRQARSGPEARMGAGELVYYCYNVRFADTLFTTPISRPFALFLDFRALFSLAQGTR